MLKAARVQGSPTMVIAISRAAKAQPSAIQKPPKTIQRILRKRLMIGMDVLLAARSAAEIAEFSVEVEIARGDLRLYPPQSWLEVLEFALQRLERVARRRADAAPESFLVAIGIKRRRLRRQRQRQDDIGDDGGRKKEDEAQHRDEPHQDGLDAEIIGDAGADAGEDSALAVAIEPERVVAAVRPSHSSILLRACAIPALRCRGSSRARRYASPCAVRSATARPAPSRRRS